MTVGLFDWRGDLIDEEFMRKVLADVGVVPMHELVRRLREGDAARWHGSMTMADTVVGAHRDASERSGKMLQALESSWSGAAADAAAEKIRTGARATQLSAEVYAHNARQYTDGAYTFDTIKQQLPTIAEKPPERDVVDILTPWDTDTEDRINQHKADVERARQIYQGYEQAMQSAQQSVMRDFGSLDAFEGELGTLDHDKSSTVKDAGTGIMTFDEPTGHGEPAGRTEATGPTSSPRTGSPSFGQQATVGGSSATPDFGTPQMPGSSRPDSGTSASGYVPPEVTRPAATAPNFSTPGYNPGPGFGPGGSNPSSPHQPPGFGPAGPHAFGPSGGGPSAGGGGRFSMPGRGGVPGGLPGGGAAGAGTAGGPGGTGAPGSGKATGSAPFGPAGGGRAAAAGGFPVGGPAGAAGGRGAMPMGAMGGGAGRGGQGGGDEEHQRQYVQASDEAFALTEDGEVLRDPVTGNAVAPPTIGG